MIRMKRLFFLISENLIFFCTDINVSFNVRICLAIIRNKQRIYDSFLSFNRHNWGQERNVQIWYNYVLSSLLPWGYSIANVQAGSLYSVTVGLFHRLGSGWKPALLVTVGKCVSICLRIKDSIPTSGWKPVPN